MARTRLFTSVIRILTPEVINELTVGSGGLQKVDLAAVIDCELNGEDYELLFEKTAKLKLVEDESEQDEKEKAMEQEADQEFELKCHPKSLELLKNYYAFWREREKSILGTKDLRKKGKSKRQETSGFILDQKKKMHESNQKLKSITIQKLYKEGSRLTLVNGGKKKESKKDASESRVVETSKGVLINKRQA